MRSGCLLMPSMLNVSAGVARGFGSGHAKKLIELNTVLRVVAQTN
jgi:hypothetical protein